MIERIEDLLPSSPDKGPPLPKILGVSWPWVKEFLDRSPGNPSPVEVRAVNAEIDIALSRKKAEWRALGATPGLIEKGEAMARGWARGLMDSPMYRPIIGTPYEEAVYRNLLMMGMDNANRWVRVMMGS